MSSTCSICDGQMQPWLTMPLDPKTFKATDYGNINRCDHCGHGVVSPLPPHEVIPSFYDLDKYYTQSQSHFTDFSLGWHDKLLTKLAWLFDKGRPFDGKHYAEKLPAQSTICEIGCGHGKHLITFKAKGHRAIGIDPDSKAVETTQNNGIEAFIGTAENLSEILQKNSVDMVIMSHSLEHCLDPLLAIKNVAHILKPDGIFVCEVPNSTCTHFMWNTICSEMLDTPRHLHFFTTQSLHKSIELAGLKVVTQEYCGFTRHHAKGWREYEINIHQHLAKVTNKLPEQHTFLRSLMLWAVTFLASPEKKYDSVRLIGKKTQET